MYCMFVPFRGWMCKTKEPGAPVCVKNCNAAGFFSLNSFLCVSRMVHHPKGIQPTWHNCGKHWSQHGSTSLWNAFNTVSSPWPDKLRLFWWQKGVQLNIRKVFLMFGILIVHSLGCVHTDRVTWSVYPFPRHKYVVGKNKSAMISEVTTRQTYFDVYSRCLLVCRYIW